MILIYLGLALIVLVSGLPLYRALRDGTSSSAIYRGGLILLLGILLDVVLVVFLSYYIEYLWFAEVQDQAQRFWQQFIIVWKLFGLLFLAGFLVAGTSFGAASVAVKQSVRSVIYGSVTYGIVAGLVLAVIGVQMDWTTFLLYLYHTPGGELDPIFGRPLSFYLFELPFYESLMGFGFILILFCVPSIFVIARSKQRKAMGAAGRLVLFGGIGFIAAGILVYLGLLLLLLRIQLVYGEHGVIHGIDYLRHTVSSPSLNILAWVAFGSAILVLFVSIFRRQDTLLAIAGSGAMLFIGWITYGVVLFIVSMTTSTANHLEVNREYIGYTMQMTRAAYNIGFDEIEEREFPIVDEMTAADLATNRATLEAARIWDYSVFDQRITQTQRVKPFYDFTDVDLDRYVDEDGRIHPVLVSLRNLDISQLPRSAGQSWVNTTMRYTHGYGVVVSPVNEFVGNGEPVYWTGNLDGTTTKPWLRVDEPRIYFGDNYDGEVFVNAVGLDEFDRPGDGEDFTNRYSCDGGIRLSSLLRRTAAVWETGRISIFFSDYFSDETRMLIKRNVSDRINAVVPFLSADSDWYTVVHEGRLVAIQDLYTTSNHYPFAEDFGEVRYIRGAVKATMDLCDGTVNLYVFDEQDPVLQTYRAAFPDLFQPRSAMPTGLEAHVRYPEGLFLHQYAAYAKYHVTDVERFYNSSDIWSAPTEQTRGREVSMAARYVVAELPFAPLPDGAEKAELSEEIGPEFVLMRPYVFKFGGDTQSRPRMTGWLAGLSDGENYGRLVAFHFPGAIHVDGTAHIEQQIEVHEPFQEDFRNWQRGNTSWFRGNLIVLPLRGGQLVAFEPIYTQAGDGAIPELKRVISVQLRPSSDDSIKIVWGRTYAESRQALLGYAHSVGLLKSGEGANLTDEELLELVFGHLTAYTDLTGDGQYATAGERLQAAITALQERVGTAEENVDNVE